MKIQPKTGLFGEVATDLFITIFAMTTDAKTVGTYYRITTEDNKQVAEGNLSLSEEEFADWGFDNVYIEDLVLTKLGLERDTDTELVEETEE